MRTAMRDRADMDETKIYNAPSGGFFRDPEDQDAELDFLPAPDLERIGSDLIGAYDELEHLARYRIVYLWKAKGGKSQGKEKLGFCQKASGLAGYLSEATWIVWLAADNVNAYQMTRRQVEALTYHELSHAGEELTDEGETKAMVNAHDWEGFNHEIERYGLWQDDLKLAEKAFRQLPLFDADKIPDSVADYWDKAQAETKKGLDLIDKMNQSGQDPDEYRAAEVAKHTVTFSDQSGRSVTVSSKELARAAGEAGRDG